MRHAALLTCLMAAIAVFGQNFTRQVPRLPKTPEKEQIAEPVAPLDTVFTPSAKDITFEGFQKTLRDVRETVFVTNHLAEPIQALKFEISYYDMSERLLHRATHSKTVALPAGETRRIDFRAFDRQGIYYYHLSPLPKHASHAIPFKIKITLLHYCK